MARTKWESRNPGGSAVEVLDQIKSAIEPVFNALRTILETTKGVLDAAKNLLIDLSDPQTLGVKAALDTVRSVLEELSGEGSPGVFMIPIPIIPIDKELSDRVLYPKPGETESILELLEIATKTGRLGSGGNYGFLETLRASMNDAKDPMRPRLDEDAHVAGFLVYFGSESYLKLISIMYKLAQLFSDKDKPSGMADAMTGGTTELPKPKQLKAELVPSSSTNALKEILDNRNSGDNNIPLAVRLTWDLEDQVHVLSWPDKKNIGKTTIELEEVVVYRAEKPISPSMNPSQLREFRIAQYPFSGWESEFYDESIDKNYTYYYAVGYKAAERDPENPDITVSLGDDPLVFSTTQITVPEDVNLFSRHGTPPDWFVFPSPLAVVPSVTNAVRKIEKAVDAIEKTLDDKLAKVKKYIEGIGDLIDYYTKLTQDVVDTVEQFIDALNWTGVYVGVVGFSGKGGNERVISEIGNALFDTSDQNRPPFDKGTEAVCGFVMLAGAETYGKLQKFITLCKYLWGIDLGINISKISEFEEEVENAWEEATQAIDAATAKVRERICLADNLSDVIDCQEKELVTQTFAADMQPDADGDTACTGN